MPSPTCRCQFGYTGSSCQYPTYYLIALGIVVFLSLLVVSVSTILYIRVKKRRREASLLQQVDELNTVWQIGDDEIKLDERIGGGGFGDVFRARYRDLTVAVKTLKCPEDENDVYEFEREIQFMQTMRHSNIVMFLGAGKFSDKDTPFIVIEYLEDGSVRDLLDKVDQVITVRQKLCFCADVAKGMSFLHTRNPPRIHRDLKCSNVLVSRNGTIKIADFGLGRQITGSRQTKVRNTTDTTPLNTSFQMSVLDIGTVRWRAPELCERKAYSTAVDVYSFGIVMWEIWTGELPFGEYRFDYQVDDAVSAGGRPHIPSDTPTDYRQLIIDCWQHAPSNRPTFPVIVQRLDRLFA
ncbi:uncharacterized protein LOC134185881 [Corticium candelabrum]|uniref:uncharacterized protein LOC134185881 n=1 Tax=Corticium candelabrum TaxID=121492 RepID=UPI002E25770A|nr:uncharacterized protein LOC134185881 [Corticium candelabrum]